MQKFPISILGSSVETRKDKENVERHYMYSNELDGPMARFSIGFLHSPPSTRKFACASPIGVNRNYTRTPFISAECTEHSDSLCPLIVIAKDQAIPLSLILLSISPLFS